MYVCSICQRQLKNKTNLAAHMKTVHRAGSPKPTAVEVKSSGGLRRVKPASTAKKFEVKVVKDKPAKQLYKCGACESALDGEISPCPSCGAELNWS